MDNMYASAKGDFSLALAGDCMLTQKISMHSEPGFQALFNLMREADATFVNLETCVRNWDEGTPTITSGTPMTTLPGLLDELKWMGVDIVACANNHAFDYGEGGILATIRHLDEAGIPHAGTGRNLAEARMPGYVETTGGRLALVATTAAFRPWNQAGGQRPDIHGRPGVNPFNFKTTYTVDGETFDALARMNEGLGFARAQERNKKHFYSDKEVAATGAEETEVFGKRVAKGNGFSITTEADAVDFEETLRAVREARRQADWVMVSFHCHEFNGNSLKTATSKVDLSEVADFVAEFAHAAIDAGADVIAGHGSHTPLGIEIYKGKPIFYSLGTFVFQNETLPFFPADAFARFDLGPEAGPADFLDVRTNSDQKGFPAYAGYWRSFVAECIFKDHRPVRIILHPIEEGFGQPRPQRGRPMIVDGELGEEIIDRVRTLSAPFGTTIASEDGRGIIDLA
jgi:poly-gamma-glutamate synthesis protein (capsule biosynthesis protein)